MASKRLILALFLLILLVGCKGGQKGKDQPEGVLSFQATGTEGLTLQFLKDQPPSRIYTSTPLTVVAQINNKGVHDISNANLYLSGFDSRIISGISSSPNSISLEGKSPFNPEGDIEIVEWSSSAVQLPPGSTTYSPNLVLTACYQYETLATPVVCVDPDPFNTLQDKSCKVGSVNTGGSQGSPIAISSVEQEVTPTDLFFRVHISNVGGGQVFDESSMTKCPSSLQFQDLNKIELREATISGKQLECKPENPIRLVDGKATIFCKTSQFTGSAFETPLTLRFSYGYKSSISQKVEIVNIGG